MSRFAPVSRSTLRRAVRRTFRLTRYLIRVYLIPFLVGSCLALGYLAPMSLVSQATMNAFVVIAMLVAPGVVVMALSPRERGRWWEYALVWLMFVTSVPVYGALLFTAGHGVVLSRAWRRQWPHTAQSEEFDDLDGGEAR